MQKHIFKRFDPKTTASQNFLLKHSDFLRYNDDFQTAFAIAGDLKVINNHDEHSVAPYATYHKYCELRALEKDKDQL